MKTKKTLFALVVSAFLLSHASATIIRVNNQVALNDAASKTYKSFNDAYTAAVNGDTLMIEGSPTPYSVTNSEISIQKRLVIIGTGYFLTSNPQTQANNSESR